MATLDRIVLISGPIAVGKTSVRRALVSSHYFDYVRSSSYLKTIANDQSLGGERTNLQDLGDKLDLQSDYRWLLDEVAAPGFALAPDQRRWLVDAVRKHKQVAHFRGMYGNVVLHVHLNANEDVLRRRFAERGEATPYDLAIQHENEVAARSLIEIADLVIDTGTTSPEGVALQIVNQR